MYVNLRTLICKGIADLSVSGGVGRKLTCKH
jgi:hypothetical protein